MAKEEVKEVQKTEEKAKGIVLQHIGRERQFTVPKDQVVRVCRGKAVVMDPDHPRFCNNLVLLPGCIIEVTPKLAETLMNSRDFQKYGLE